MKKTTFLSLFFLLAGWACQPAQKEPVVPANNAMTQEVFVPENNGYKLVWKDDFNGTKLDTTKWALRGLGPEGSVITTPQWLKLKTATCC